MFVERIVTDAMGARLMIVSMTVNEIEIVF